MWTVIEFQRRPHWQYDFYVYSVRFETSFYVFDFLRRSSGPSSFRNVVEIVVNIIVIMFI